MPRRRLACFLALIGWMAAGALCAGSAASAAQPAQAVPGAEGPARATVQVDNAWVPQPPPGASVAAAYFTVRNAGRQRAELIEVSSPVASEAMLHETTIVAGESRMRMLERLVIPAGGTVTLKPGAIHVMLEGLNAPLHVGEAIPLVLRFANGEEIHVSARVRPLGSR
ncbi:MAG TPA: copper chaperone PCu(A)C [Steroidobacteraceae bacterium]|nr:copper chaperone PCu(A)C [Steroidobacteraceae bacterium]